MLGPQGSPTLVLSGTLVVNSLDDIYPHLHFLQISPSAQWEHFREHISKLQKRYVSHFITIHCFELNFFLLAKTCHKSSAGKSLCQLTMSDKHI